MGKKKKDSFLNKCHNESITFVIKHNKTVKAKGMYIKDLNTRNWNLMRFVIERNLEKWGRWKNDGVYGNRSRKKG